MAAKLATTKATKTGTRRRKAKAKAPRFTTEELNKEFDIVLNTHNPYMSKNCVEFDRKSGAYKPVLDYRKPVLVLKYQGTLKKKKSEGEKLLFGEGEGEEKKKPKEEKKMRNKFNFRNVSTQTHLRHSSEHGNQTDTSLFAVCKFKGQVSKTIIQASYERHERQSQLSVSTVNTSVAEKKKGKGQYSWIQDALKNIRKYVGRKATEFPDSNKKYLRICERMVDQNLSEGNLDYSYYDNPYDEFSPTGSLLPLWRFKCNQTKRLPVTDIAWSNHFSDLFAVGYRTFKEDEPDEDDLGMIREGGVICVYSLKGPNYPEKILRSSAGVCCLSFHPVFPHFLVAGCAGGIINVYDLRREFKDPAGTNKMTEKTFHFDTVNKLTWFPDVQPQKFCTVSTDGKVLSWQFWMNDLALSDDVTSLKIKASVHRISTQMAGTSISFNPQENDLFVVGTETGVLKKCSLHEKKQLDTYEVHQRKVFRVQWNSFHPRVFLSASDDMTVRIWDHTMRESVIDFFFENEVKDASWAPFSSTLFAVITGASTVHVFDIAVSKEALGSFTVYTAKEGIGLTSVSFHPTKPVLMVGDERGHVVSFKLSPNLRSSLQAETIDEEREYKKMEKLIRQM